MGIAALPLVHNTDRTTVAVYSYKKACAALLQVPCVVQTSAPMLKVQIIICPGTVAHSTALIPL